MPTIRETVPGFAIDVWFGFSAPAKTPADLFDTLHADMAEVLRDPEFLTDSFGHKALR